MKTWFITVLSLLEITIATIVAQTSTDYFGQTPPGNTLVVFAPGIVSGTSLKYSATAFSSDVNYVYWISRKNQSDKITSMEIYRVSVKIIYRLRKK